MQRGQFFSVDVFIASVILISGTVVLVFSVVSQSNLQPAQLFSSDILRETLTKSVRELNYDVLTKPAPNGYADPNDPYGIKDQDLSLGQLIGEYHHLASQSSGPAQDAYLQRRDDIANRTIVPLISSHYSYEVSIGNQTSRDTISERIRIPRSDSEYVVASRSIVAGIDRNREFFGPLTLEVLVWN